MQKEELRELLWWAFRQGSEQQEHYDKADGKCLDQLEYFEAVVNTIVDKEFKE